MLLDVDMSCHNEVADLHWEVNRLNERVRELESRSAILDTNLRVQEDSLNHFIDDHCEECHLRFSSSMRDFLLSSSPGFSVLVDSFLFMLLCSNSPFFFQVQRCLPLSGSFRRLDR